MNPFTEVKEIGSTEVSEAGRNIQAFENEKKQEVSVRHIPTINENLEGSGYPDMNVEYKRHTFWNEGEKMEGVFPVFESRFDTVLPRDMRTASDTEQFRYCTKRLGQAIERDPGLAEGFTERQLAQIRDGAPRISGLTWHHNEVPGKMQLVDAQTHAVCRHTGGRSVWGGGAECR